MEIRQALDIKEGDKRPRDTLMVAVKPKVDLETLHGYLPKPAKVLSIDELELYDYWKKKEWDHINALKLAQEKGKAEGKTEIAILMLKKGLNDKLIHETTGLSLEKILQIKETN